MKPGSGELPFRQHKGSGSLHSTMVKEVSLIAPPIVSEICSPTILVQKSTKGAQQQFIYVSPLHG